MMSDVVLYNDGDFRVHGSYMKFTVERISGNNNNNGNQMKTTKSLKFSCIYSLNQKWFTVNASLFLMVRNVKQL